MIIQSVDQSVNPSINYFNNSINGLNITDTRCFEYWILSIDSSLFLWIEWRQLIKVIWNYLIQMLLVLINFYLNARNPLPDLENHRHNYEYLPIYVRWLAVRCKRHRALLYFCHFKWEKLHPDLTYCAWFWSDVYTWKMLPLCSCGIIIELRSSIPWN